MKERGVSLSTIALIAGTRVALCAGIGLLLANRLSPEQRRAAGLALLGFGVLTTIPLVASVLGNEHKHAAQQIGDQHDPQARKPVDRDAADEQEQQHWGEGEDEHRAHGASRAGFLQHPPRQPDLVQAIAKPRDRLPTPQQRERAIG